MKDNENIISRQRAKIAVLSLENANLKICVEDLKAEIENQNLEIDILIRKKKSLRDEIAELSASVEELKKTVAGKQTIINELSELITDTCEDCKVKLDANKVKSKAIREFADELFTKFAGHSDYHGDTILCQIICMADGKTTDVAKPLDTSTIKSKAIIEFAERLKKTMTSTRCDKNGYCHYVTEDCEIDNLVKEMVGDAK